jgi:hypothetical protein
MSTKYINDARIYANSIIKNPDDNDIQRIAESFYARDQEVYRSQLEYLQQDSEAIEEEGTPADDGGFRVEVNGTVTTAAMVQEAIKAVGEAETRRKLKNAGLNDNQINDLINGDLNIGSNRLGLKQDANYNKRRVNNGRGCYKPLSYATKSFSISISS